MRRRGTIQTVLVFALWLSVSSAATGQETQADPSLVPADKGLSHEYLAGLFERGQRAVYKGEELETIGMPVGGIAAGPALPSRRRARSALWQIFNKPIFSG